MSIFLSIRLDFSANFQSLPIFSLRFINIQVGFLSYPTIRKKDYVLSLLSYQV